MIMNAGEVFEMAAQIERNGRDFYLKVAGIAQKSENKKLFQKLAEMERKHEETFLEMKNIFVKESESAIPDIDGQALSYIKAMADGNIFGKTIPSELINEQASAKEIFSVALSIEKDAVVFYSAIKKMVLRNTEKEQIDILINEELGHIAIISREILVASS